MTYTIAYLFCDYGAEAEALSTVGEVHRFTIDPKPNPYIEETTTMDLMADTPDIDADLAVAHPKCTKYSTMTSISGNPDDHVDQIPRARELCQEIADHYIIENKPRAPLHEPTVLDGKMFGLPIAYERAFETSFPIRCPPRQQTLETECSPYFSADRTKAWWATIKGTRGEYPKEHLVKNTLPLAYIDCLTRSWLRQVNEQDAQVAQDNNSPPPVKLDSQQMRLSVETDGSGKRQ